MSKPTPTPDRIKRPERQPYLNTILVALPIVSTLMLLIAMINLGAGGGWLEIAKIVLLPIAAFMLSYATYRMAIEKAATLISVGMLWAAPVGLISILIVGIGLFMATYPGLVIGQVEERSLQSYLSASIRTTDERIAVASQAGRAVPVTTAITSDLEDKTECETETSCVSLRGPGGYGPTARTLETLAGRAASVRDEAALGLERRDAILHVLSNHRTRMESVLADESKSVWKRRVELRQHDAELGQLLTALDEAVPVAMLAAYAGELRSGITIPNRPDVTDRINAMLAGYADGIDDVLAGISQDDIASIPFPPRTGAIQTFAYIGEYAPIALLTFAVELVFPITLWAYTVMTLIWLRYRSNPEGDAPAPRDNAFEDLTNIRPFDPKAYRNGQVPPAPRPNTRNHRH